jgi:hypothetical protein
MMAGRRGLALLIVFVASVSLWSQRKPAIENDQVRVLVVTDPPHRKGALHEHLMNRVMIYLDGGEQTLSYADGRVDVIKFKPGEARWSAAGGKHTSENTGGRPYRVVEVELRNHDRVETQFPALYPVKLHPTQYVVLLNNAQVRVLRARTEGRQRIMMHEHTLNRVVTFLTPQRFRVTDDSGKISEASAEAGEVHWAGPVKHVEDNLSDQPLEVVVVELK